MEGASNPGRQQLSLADYYQMHPYQYLVKLNQVYLGYDRCTSNYNSTSSMIKLPFKSFSTMKVPDCFARSYEHERKELIQTDASEADHEDSHEKKLWKEHKQIMRRFVEEQRQAKGKSHFVQGNSLGDNYRSTAMLNDRSNIFLKRIKQKGAKLHYDENKLKEEVITKLQSINPKAAKPQGRSQTANSSTRSKSQQTLQGGVPQARDMVREDEYLETNSMEELIRKYQSIIRKVDCSISEKNVRKTCLILRELQNVAGKRE